MSTARTHSDRRRHPRFELVAQVQVKHAKYTYVMDVANISLGGMLLDLGDLEPPPWVRRGQVVELALSVIGELDVLAFEARIVRTETRADRLQKRFAVEFDALDARTRADLERLVARLSGGHLEPPPLPPR